jgi:hypothetical protein
LLKRQSTADLFSLFDPFALLKEDLGFSKQCAMDVVGPICRIVSFVFKLYRRRKEAKQQQGKRVQELALNVWNRASDMKSMLVNVPNGTQSPLFGSSKLFC